MNRREILTSLATALGVKLPFPEGGNLEEWVILNDKDWDAVALNPVFENGKFCAFKRVYTHKLESDGVSIRWSPDLDYEKARYVARFAVPKEAKSTTEPRLVIEEKSTGRRFFAVDSYRFIKDK